MSNAEGNLEIYLGSLGGEEPVRLTSNARDDYHLTWSPNGEYLAFTSQTDGDAEIYTVAVADGVVKRLTREPGADSTPSWSPDSQRIAFISERSGRTNLFTMAADGSDVKQLTHYEATIKAPHWSPDGAQIVFTLGNNLAAVNADGSGLRKLTNLREVRDQQPRWSPDSSKVVYTQIVDDVYNIHVVDVVSGVSTQLTDSKSFDTDPQWSPDGSKILWLSARDGGVRKQLFVMASDGSDIKQLTGGGREVLTPSWSPDGRQVTFARHQRGRFAAETLHLDDIAPGAYGEPKALGHFGKGLELSPQFRPTFKSS